VALPRAENSLGFLDYLQKSFSSARGSAAGIAINNKKLEKRRSYLELKLRFNSSYLCFLLYK